MSDKIFNILATLCLVAVIGYMSWRSMHPPLSGHPTSAPISYYAGDGITPADFPADNNPVTVDVGTFSYAPDGRMTWTPGNLPAVTISQRQINLQFRFDGLPQAPAKTIQKLETVLKSWTHKGDIVNILIFDYDGAKPDFTAYANLINATNAHFTKEYTSNPYAVYPTLNLRWMEAAQSSFFEKLNSSTVAVLSIPETHIPQKLFKHLADFEFQFILRFPEGKNVADIDMPHLIKLKALNGVTLTLDPHKPLFVKKDPVGLFPKL